MQTKKLAVSDYHVKIGMNFLRKMNSIKKSSLLIILFLLLLFTYGFTIISDFYNSLNTTSSKNSVVTEFKFDINKLSTTAKIIETERQGYHQSNINAFGSDGNVIAFNEITPDLKTALINIADLNNDKQITDEEIAQLQIMKLKTEDFQKELGKYQYSLKSADCNLKNYVVITTGKYAGTILYNGPLKFIDNRNRQYFGLEIFN